MALESAHKVQLHESHSPLAPSSLSDTGIPVEIKVTIIAKQQQQQQNLGKYKWI